MLLGSVASVAARPGGGHILRLTWHQVSAVSTQIDPSRSDPATGDAFSSGFIVLRYASPHDQIGTAGIKCTWIEAGDAELLCDAAFILPDGKITTQTLIRPADGDVRRLSITGGTGAYRGVSGELTVTSINDTDELGVFRFDD